MEELKVGDVYSRKGDWTVKVLNITPFSRDGGVPTKMIEYSLIYKNEHKSFTRIKKVSIKGFVMKYSKYKVSENEKVQSNFL